MEANFSFNSPDSYLNFPAATTASGDSFPGSLNHHPQPSSFHRSLHSVRKPPIKKPTAPLPPNPSRVYKVDRMNFRELVQMLTGAAASSSSADAAVPASRSQPRRLREVAPPPLNFAAPSAEAAVAMASTPLSAVYQEMMSDTLSDAKPVVHHKLFTDDFLGNQGAVSLGLGLSPSPRGWSSVPLLSPGTFV